MGVTSRRVRLLRLKGPSRELLGRGALLLEDALRTASFPAEGGERVLILRRIPTLAIDARRAPAALATALESRVRPLASSAVHAGAGAARMADAVYFHDEAEPYRLLAARIARGASLDAWFWPLAIPGFNAASPPIELLRGLLFGSLGLRARVSAAIALLEELVRGGTLERLCAALRFQDGPALWTASGLAKPAQESSSSPPSALDLPAAWRNALADWIRAWGASDGRSTWLVAMALVSKRPARLAGAALAPRALSAARMLAAGSFAISRAAQAVAAMASSPATVNRPNGEDPLAPWFEEEDLARSQPRPEAPSRSSDRSAAVEAAEDCCGPPAEGAAAPRSLQEEPPAGVVVLAESGGDAGAEGVARAQRVGAGAPRSDRAEGSQAATAVGGIYFLVPILARLGFAGWLADNAAAVEWDLPARVLRGAAAMVGVDPDDPALAALASPAEHAAEPRAFVAPRAFWQGLCRGRGLRVRRLAAGGDQFVIDDGPRGLPLAVYRGPMPCAVRTLIGARPLRGGPGGIVPAMPALVRCWLTASRRWLRHHTGLSLEQLLLRRARVKVTRTHLSIVFPHALADLRIRRAGLDLDPGWVPWLGRVVLFKYRDDPAGGLDGR